MNVEDDEEKTEEECVDERRLQLYIKKLRSLEVQKHNISEQMKETHNAQLNRIMQQQQMQIQNLMAPFNAAIGETFGNIQTEIIALEKVIGASGGKYCRYCFEWSKECKLNCRKCERMICGRCAVKCTRSNCMFAFCRHCDNEIEGFWKEEDGKLLCVQCSQ